MKISKRLNCIADMIEANSKVIDVGCDHGLLSIFLAKEKQCHCIAADINENALNSARINIKKYNADIELKLTDGLDGINIDEDDYIVIAGMGSTTIKHILDGKKLSNNLIISSNNHLEELRKFVTSIGYKIEDEQFIVEHNKKYVIIKFVRGKEKYSKIDFKYGPIIKNNVEYLIFELEKLYQIKEKIKNGNLLIKYKNQKAINNIKKLIGRKGNI